MTSTLVLSKVPRSLLWVTDPWATLTRDQDTTLRLAEEASKLGVLSYWSGIDFIFDAPENQLKVIRVSTNFDEKPEFLSASDFCQIHYRVDPPVDSNYKLGIEKLLKRGVSPSQILNPIKLIMGHSEKIPPAGLSHLAPRLKIVANMNDARMAFQLFHLDSNFVTKPMNLAQSIGVKKWSTPKNETLFIELLDQETSQWTIPLLVEEYLPEIDQGEVRMWFAFGKFISALKKFPKSGDFRVLIDEGSKIEAHTLSQSEEKIAREVGLNLSQASVALAAIDFISGKICDFNITSPGLLIQLEQAHGKNFAKEIILELIQRL